MPQTCYVTFEANPTAQYAYRCGGLSPIPGRLVVIELKNGRKKLVTCAGVSEAVDPKATKEIFALLLEQPNAYP